MCEFVDENHFGWRVSRQVIDEGKNLVVVSATVLSGESDIGSISQSFVHPPQCLVHGVTYPPMLTEKKWSKLNTEVQYRNSDIFVVSYPKSGTTWIEQCVLLIINGGNKSLLNPAIKNAYSSAAPESGGKIWLEACIEQDIQVLKLGEEFRSLSFEELDAAPSPRVFKSHAPSKMFLGMNDKASILPGAKVIVMSRNPLDSCVSRFYHAFNPYKSGWSFPAWAAVWLSGNTTYGCWFEWVRDWSSRAKTNKDQILWLQYEDMIQDPHTETKKIIDFLNVSKDQDIPALIDKVVEGCSFASMKNQANEKEGFSDFQGHLRKGIMGDWENHFTDEIKTEFLRKYSDDLAGTELVYNFGGNLGRLSA